MLPHRRELPGSNMHLQGHDNETSCKPEDYAKAPSKNQKDLEVQLILSIVLGASALIAFCVGRRLASRRRLLS